MGGWWKGFSWKGGAGHRVLVVWEPYDWLESLVGGNFWC